MYRTSVCAWVKHLEQFAYVFQIENNSLQKVSEKSAGKFWVIFQDLLVTRRLLHQNAGTEIIMNREVNKTECYF